MQEASKSQISSSADKSLVKSDMAFSTIFGIACRQRIFDAGIKNPRTFPAISHIVNSFPKRQILAQQQTEPSMSTSNQRA